MPDLFVAYASEDQPLVKQLVEELKQTGWSVWWDKTDIESGSIRLQIENAISAAKRVIVVWSQNSKDSSWVIGEAEVAKRLDKTLVQVRIDDVDPPLGFGHLHFCDLIDWSGSSAHPEIVCLQRHLREDAETSAEELDEGNFYYASTFADYANSWLMTNVGVTLDSGLLDSGLTVDDLVSDLAAMGIERGAALKAAHELRGAYYTDKYSVYDDSADLRSIIPDWNQDLNEVYEFNRFDVGAADVIYVGAGTGRDLPRVCPKSRSLLCVDVSEEMLKLVESHRADASTLPAAAERLRGIEDDSFDLYLSLRVFQSSLLSIRNALREARRVLRRGGLVVISIPDAYVDEHGTENRVVRGLLVGSRIDQSRPHVIAGQILKSFSHLGFSQTGMIRKRADVYLWSRAS